MLAKLNGSEKQIEWAVDIRDKIITQIAERRGSEWHTIDRWSAKEPTPKLLASIERHKANISELDALENYIRNVSDAKYFITNKDYNIDGHLLHWRAANKPKEV